MDSLPKINIMEFGKYINHDHVVLLFSADWCPDCAVIKPLLPTLEAEFPQWKFWLVDVDSHREIVKTLNIFGIPSLVAFERGQEVGRLVNKKRKSRQELEEFLGNLPASAVE